MNQPEYGKNKVKHNLCNIDLHSLVGSFDEVIAYLQEEKKQLEKRYSKPVKMFIKDPSTMGLTAFPEQVLVKVDRLFIECNKAHYEDDYELQVWGERDMLPIEKQALEKLAKQQEKNREQQELAEFERLQKKFGKK
jgi:hypothetical protein